MNTATSYGWLVVTAWLEKDTDFSISLLTKVCVTSSQDEKISNIANPNPDHISKINSMKLMWISS